MGLKDVDREGDEDALLLMLLLNDVDSELEVLSEPE